MVTESVILVVVGGFLGVIGTVVGTLVNYRLRQEERKSDRERELYERDLKVVTDVVNALVEVVDAIEWSAHAEPDLSPDARLELGREAHLMAGRANVIALSLDDQQLDERLRRLIRVFNRYIDLLDLDTGEAEVGSEEELEELREGVRRTGAEMLRRIREILEEV